MRSNKDIERCHPRINQRAKKKIDILPVASVIVQRGKGNSNIVQVGATGQDATLRDKNDSTNLKKNMHVLWTRCAAKGLSANEKSKACSKLYGPV